MKSWMPLEPMGVPRSSASAAAMGGQLWVLGGTSGSRQRTVERYDARAGKWESVRRGPSNPPFGSGSSQGLKASKLLMERFKANFRALRGPPEAPAQDIWKAIPHQSSEGGGSSRSSNNGGSGSSSTQHHHQLDDSDTESSSLSSSSSEGAEILAQKEGPFQDSFVQVSCHLFVDPNVSESEVESDAESVNSDKGRGSSVISAFSAQSAATATTFQSVASAAPSASAQSVDYSVASSLPELRLLPPEMPAADDTVLPTPGSLGHPELCQRACIYFGSGPCQNGAFCGYCHLPHTTPPVKLNKRQRLLLQRLRASELLAIIHDKLRIRARDQGFLLEADDMLQQVEELLHHAQQSDTTAVPSLSDESHGNLSRVLGRMSMAGLLGFIIRLQDVDREIIDRLVQEVAILKAKLFHQLADGRPRVRSAGQACCCLDRLYAFGGTDQNQRVHSSLEGYNPEAGGSWIFRKSMQAPMWCYDGIN
eukprot:s1071_g8.t2